MAGFGLTAGSGRTLPFPVRQQLPAMVKAVIPLPKGGEVDGGHNEADYQVECEV